MCAVGEAARTARGAARRLPLAGAELERRGARGRACGLRPTGARDCDHVRAEAEQPRERDFGGCRVVRLGDLAEHRAAGEARCAARPAERRVGDQRETRLGASLYHAAAERLVVDHAEGNLYRGDRSELECLVQLTPVDVREPDVRHQTVLEEPGERAHRRAPRRSRVGSVEEVEVDREPVECLEARLAVRADGLRAAVGDPGPGWSRHTALCHDARSHVGAAPAQCTGQQPLVVAELVLSEPVRACGVEHGDAGASSGRDGRERLLLVPVGVRRQPHAAEPDP